jgi:hypothetical protein
MVPIAFNDIKEVIDSDWVIAVYSKAMKVFSFFLDIYPDWHTEELKLI